MGCHYKGHPHRSPGGGARCKDCWAAPCGRRSIEVDVSQSGYSSNADDVDEWHMNVDPCAVAGFRRQRQTSTNETRTLPHADQPEAAHMALRARIEADPVVEYAQLNLIRCTLQRHRHCRGPAVFDDIVQSFLHDSIEGERHIARDVDWERADLASDDDGSCVRHLVAQATNGRGQPKLSKQSRMEFMGETAQRTGDAINMHKQFLDLTHALLPEHPYLGR